MKLEAKQHNLEESMHKHRQHNLQEEMFAVFHIALMNPGAHDGCLVEESLN